MNPYAEIEVTPLYSRDGMESQGKSVRIMDEDTPGGWQELGVVSSNYLLVHNAKVKEVVDQIAALQAGCTWNPRKIFFDGKRFVYSVTTDNITAEVAPGDLIRFGLIASNSYDATRALSVGAYAEHLVCSNGMTSEMYFARFVFRHHQGNVNWNQETERAFSMLLPASQTRLSRFADTLHKLRNRNLSVADLKVLRVEHLGELSATTWGRVMDRYLTHEPHHAFGFLDACTQTFWHAEKQSISDYRNNSVATTALINFASRLN